MKPLLGSPLLGFSSALVASVAIVAMANPAIAAPTEVTAVEIKPTNTGFNLELKTRFGDRPQVFSAPRGRSWVADVINTQLKLRGSSQFRQDNPAPGIASLQVIPLDSNSIRIVVTGTDRMPSGELLERSTSALSFNINSDPGVALQPSTAPRPTGAAPTQQGQIAQPAGSGSGAAAGGIAQQPKPPSVLVPNPPVTIDGQPAVQQDLRPVPPFLPRAVAPPVGDIAISEINFQGTSVDLGTAVRIPRLVLRDAPAREVLSLLARAAGLNLAFSERSAGDTGAQPAAPAAAGSEGGPKITLDVENESVQDVFNSVLRLSGLEASRSGRTIFAGPRLPNDLKDLVVRTYRLNQVTADQASAFLASMGAERVITATVRETKVESVDVGAGDNAPQLTQTSTTEKTTLQTDRAELKDSVPILRGVQVLGDTRTNSITIVGPRNLVAVASKKVTELDLRKRQVALNVRVVDVNLSNLTRLGTSFSFGAAGGRFLSDGGIGIFNFDSSKLANDSQRSPAFPGSGLTPDIVGQTAVGAGQFNDFNIAKNFVGQLQANIQNGNAKVLTDPTVVVQEGQTATVELSEEVISNFKQETTAAGAGGIATTTITVEKERAGLNLGLQVDRIDDNGFINVSISPSIKGIAGARNITIGNNTNQVVLLSERKLSSGTIRLRDGQTLILAGIIQDTDRNLISKVPILGDLPILGSLFRRTERTTQRNEVIVIVTPQVLDDSDRSTFGYAYIPGSESRQLLNSSQNR